MSLLSRYIFKQVLTQTIAITLCLVGLAVLARSLGIIEMMVNKGLSFQNFLIMLLMLIPSFVQVILPIALSVACVFTYNKMHSDNEMMILHSSGLHPRKIAFPSLLIAGICGAFLIYNAGYLMPSSFTKIENIKADLVSKVATSILEPQTFTDLSKGRTLYFESIENGEMREVIIRDESDAALPATTFARGGKFVDIEDRSFLVLTGVEQVGFSETNQAPFRIQSGRQVIKIGDKAEVKERRKRVKEMLLPELRAARQDLEPGRVRSKMSKYLHTGLSAPFLLFALVLLIINLMINVERSRQGLGKRITLALSLMVFFSLTDAFAESAIGKDDERWMLVYVNALLVLPVAYFLPRVLRRLA